MVLSVDIKKAIEILKIGGVVGLPTETVYGLAGSITSEVGIRRIFETKERPFFDPLIVHCCSIEQAKSQTRSWSAIHQRLAEVFWPGPLTMVIDKNASVSDLITSGLPQVGLRIPKHEVALAVIRGLGCPVAAPSANKFGKTSPTSAQHVRDEFGSDVFVVDGGPCDIGIESTVLEVVESADDVLIKILRPGMIQPVDLLSAIKDLGKPARIDYASSLAAPGQLAAHYQPAIPLVIAESGLSEDQFGIWSVETLKLQISQGVELRLSEFVSLAARELYAQLRKLSGSGASFIYFKKSASNSGAEWEPVWNRLYRAATYRI